MKYKHWFFDLDGTLARTGEDIILAWKGAIRAVGRDLSHFDEVFKIGPTLEQMVYALYDDATPELVEDLMARFKPLYDESGFPNTVAYPGVPELLAEIHAAGGKAYIVTNKRHNATQLHKGRYRRRQGERPCDDRRHLGLWNGRRSRLGRHGFFFCLRDCQKSPEMIQF